MNLNEYTAVVSYICWWWSLSVTVWKFDSLHWTVTSLRIQLLIELIRRILWICWMLKTLTVLYRYWSWACLFEYYLIFTYWISFTCTQYIIHRTFDMKRLTMLRAAESLLNRNSKSSSEGCRTKEPSDPVSTLRLASRKKNCVTPRSLCDTDRRGSVLRDRHAGERSKPGLTVITIHRLCTPTQAK